MASNALTLFIVVLIRPLACWGDKPHRGALAQAICFVDKGALPRSAAAGSRGAISDARIFRIGADYSQAAKDLKFGSYLIQPTSRATP